jgi:hypothetical protein
MSPRQLSASKPCEREKGDGTGGHEDRRLPRRAGDGDPQCRIGTQKLVLPERVIPRREPRERDRDVFGMVAVGMEVNK